MLPLPQHFLVKKNKANINLVGLVTLSVRLFSNFPGVPTNTNEVYVWLALSELPCPTMSTKTSSPKIKLPIFYAIRHFLDVYTHTHFV